MVQVKDVSIGSGKPQICASITETDRKAIVAAADILLQKRVDIIEWRLDFYREAAHWDMVRETLQRLKMSLYGRPLLVTFRTKAEGGHQEIAHAAYRELLERIADSRMADMIDVEIFQSISFPEDSKEDDTEQMQQCIREQETWIEKLRESVIVVGSYHNFDMTPEDTALQRRIAIMDACGADILKMAVMPQNRMDVLRLMSFTLQETQKRSKPLITMSMGNLGSISRVAGEAFGSSVTFGSIGQASAPGQLPVNKLEEMLDMVHQSYQ